MPMTLKQLSSRCLAAVAATAVAALFSACASEPPAYDLRSIQANERQGALEVRPEPMRPLPTTLQSPYLTSNGQVTNVEGSTTQPTTGPSLESSVILRMPLQEIIHRAVANNLDVKVAGYQPAIDETRVTEAEAHFDPTFFQNLQYQVQDQTNGFNFPNENFLGLTTQTGVRQNMPSGGQAEIHYDGGWFEPTNHLFHQFWNNQLVFDVTQPLLRNFGNEINRARITINRNNQRVSLLDFRKQLEQSVSDIEKAFWNLVSAEREVQIDEELLEQTIKTGDVLYARRGQDVTRVQLSQANSSIESRRAVLIRAKAHVRDLSDQIKRLMNDPDMPVSSGVLILPPPDSALEEPIQFDLKDQIDTALENRLELGKQQFQIDSADVALKVADNNLLPQLNAVGTASFQGLDNDLESTIGEQTSGRHFNYTLGLQLEIPIGNREARAIYQRALLQRQQAVVSYANLVEQVALDVKQAAREVNTTWDEMIATRQARFAQADALSAIEQRELGGEALTPTFVQLKLDTQERLAEAATSEVEAVSRYNTAIAALEQAKGTLLRYNNIVMEEENLPIGYRPSIKNK